MSKVFMGDFSVLNRNYSSVVSISAQGLGPDCAQSLVKLRASRARVFSADHRMEGRVVPFVSLDGCVGVLFLVSVLIFYRGVNRGGAQGSGQ
jgi:hypothetical protein